MHKPYSLYTLPWLVFFVGTVCFYVRGRLRATKQSGESLLSWREAALAAWVGYIGLIITLTIFVVQQKIAFFDMPSFACWRLRSGHGINFQPFHEIRIFLNMTRDWRFFVNIFGNLAVFIPIACGLPLFWKRFQNIWKTLAVCFAFICGIEFLQLFVGRYVDIDDLFLNFTGAVLGYFAFQIGTRYWAWLRTLAR